MGKFFLGCFTETDFDNTLSDIFFNQKYYVYILTGVKGKDGYLKDTADDVYYGWNGKIAATVDYNTNIVYIDGDYPYNAVPRYPVIRHSLINLNSEMKDVNLSTLLYEYDEYYKYLARTARYMSAIGAICVSVRDTAESSIDMDKLGAYIQRLSKKIFRDKKELKGKTLRRQLSSVTSNGYETFIPEGYEVYLIKDDNFAGADYLIKKIAYKSSEYGYDAALSKHNFFSSGVMEHMIIPKLKIAFVTSNFLTQIDENKSEGDNIINFSRFYNKDLLAKRKNRLAFDRKSISSLGEELFMSLKTASQIYGSIERFYTA